MDRWTPAREAPASLSDRYFVEMGIKYRGREARSDKRGAYGIRRRSIEEVSTETSPKRKNLHRGGSSVHLRPLSSQKSAHSPGSWKVLRPSGKRAGSST